MMEILSNPYVWFIAGGIFWAATCGLIAHLLAIYVWPRYPVVEVEPKIDMALFDAEMEMEAAVLEYRLANERRAEMIAGAS